MTTQTEVETLETELEELDKQVIELSNKILKLRVGDVKAVSTPCLDCMGTGETEKTWEQDLEECNWCSGTGYRSLPLWTEKRDYSEEVDLLDSLQ